MNIATWELDGFRLTPQGDDAWILNFYGTLRLRLKREQLDEIHRVLNAATKEADAPERHGERWGEEEDAELVRLFEDGLSIDRIARIHRRSRGAIDSRLVRLGKLEASAVSSVPYRARVNTPSSLGASRTRTDSGIETT